MFSPIIRLATAALIGFLPISAFSTPVLSDNYEPWNKHFYAGASSSKSWNNAFLYGINYGVDYDYINWSKHDENNSYYKFEANMKWSLSKLDDQLLFSFGNNKMAIGSNDKDWDGVGLLFSANKNKHLNTFMDFKITSWNYQWLDVPISYQAYNGTYDYFELIDSNNNRINEVSGELNFSWVTNYWSNKYNKKNPELSFYVKGIDYSYVVSQEAPPLTNDVPVYFGGIFAVALLLMYRIKNTTRRGSI